MLQHAVMARRVVEGIVGIVAGVRLVGRNGAFAGAVRVCHKPALASDASFAFEGTGSPAWRTSVSLLDRIVRGRPRARRPPSRLRPALAARPRQVAGPRRSGGKGGAGVRLVLTAADLAQTGIPPL